MTTAQIKGEPGGKLARTEALLRIAHKLAAWPAEDDILQSIVQVARDTLGAELALISLREADGEHIRVVAQAGMSGERADTLRQVRYHIPRDPFAARIYNGG